MSSPFHIFRKHQKLLLATLGLAAMIAFCVPYAVFQGYGRSSSKNPVVVRTKKYGKLKERELRLMRDRRNLVVRFIRGVERAVEDNKGKRMACERFLGAIGSASEEAVVTTWLFAKEANRQKMVVSDQTVTKFLEELTDNHVSLKEFQGILANLRLSEPILYDMLKYELSALRLQQMIQPSLPATLPEQLWGNFTPVPQLSFQPSSAPPRQRWDYFTRLNREATIEVAPIKVEDFAVAADIPDPGDEVLEEFFEEYKENFSYPEWPEPGFRERHKIAVRYFKADAEQFQNEESISDDEIYETYLKEREKYDRLPPAFVDALAKQAKRKKEEKEPAGQPESPQKKPEGKADSQPKNDKATQKSGKPKPEDNKKKPETADEPDGEKPDKSSSTMPSSPFTLASYLQEKDSGEEADEGANEEEKSVEKKTPDEKKTPGEKKTPDEKTEIPGEKKELGDKETEPTPPSGAEKAEPKEKTGDEKSKKPSEPKEPAAVPKTSPKTPVVLKPKTRKEIVDGGIGYIIRMELSRSKMDEALGALEEKMRKFRKTWNRYEARRVQNENAEAPEKLDFEALAAEHPGITAFQTPLISSLEAREYDIGKSYIGGSPNHPFDKDAYIENWQVYLPLKSMDQPDNHYLFWKNDDVKARVPEFQQVRLKVLKAWRMVKARERAMEEAERLAEKARNAGGSLAKALAGEKGITVTEAGPFSWMTVGYAERMSSEPNPHQSNVDGVELAGTEFMKAVFAKIRPGGVGTAMNQPKRIAYVVRVREVQPSDTVLWELFEKDNYGRYSNVAKGDILQMLEAYRKEVAREAGLVWERAPVKVRQ